MTTLTRARHKLYPYSVLGKHPDRNGHLDALACQLGTQTQLAGVQLQQLLEAAATQEGTATSVVRDQETPMLGHDVRADEFYEVRHVREDPKSP